MPSSYKEADKDSSQSRPKGGIVFMKFAELLVETPDARYLVIVDEKNRARRIYGSEIRNHVPNSSSEDLDKAFHANFEAMRREYTKIMKEFFWLERNYGLVEFLDGGTPNSGPIRVKIPPYETNGTAIEGILRKKNIFETSFILEKVKIE